MAKKINGKEYDAWSKEGMSQVDLANALSVDRAYISNIENGRMNPTLSTRYINWSNKNCGNNYSIR